MASLCLSRSYTHTMNRYTMVAKTWFYDFMHVQLFITLISMPLLIAWGLPFSVMTVVGNVLFTPFLLIFLMISTAVFFSELLALPNQWLIALLETFFNGWIWILKQGSTAWLYGIDKGGLLLGIGCALTACCVLYHKQWGKEKNSWQLFTLLLIPPFGYQKIRSFFPRKGSITCTKKTAFLSLEKGKLIVTDHGALGEKKSSGAWVQYSFLPETLKQCGSIAFSEVICRYVNTQTLEALITLCQHASVQKITVVHPIRKSKQYKELWKKLEEVTREKGCMLTASDYAKA